MICPKRRRSAWTLRWGGGLKQLIAPWFLGFLEVTDEAGGLISSVLDRLALWRPLVSDHAADSHLLGWVLPVVSGCLGHPADEASQGLQVFSADCPADGVRPGVLLVGQGVDGIASPLGEVQEVLPAPCRIGLPDGPTLSDDIIGHPLHALTGQAQPDPPCDGAT